MREALGHLQAGEGFLYMKVYFRAASKSRGVLCLCSPTVLMKPCRVEAGHQQETQLELHDSASSVCTATELLQLSNQWAPLESSSCRCSESHLHQPVLPGSCTFTSICISVPFRKTDFRTWRNTRVCTVLPAKLRSAHRMALDEEDALTCFSFTETRQM